MAVGGPLRISLSRRNRTPDKAGAAQNISHRLCIEIDTDGLDPFRQRSQFLPQRRLFGGRRPGVVELKSVYPLCGWQEIGAGIETGSEQNELPARFQGPSHFIVDLLRAGDARGSGTWQPPIEEPLHKPASCLTLGNPVDPLAPPVEEQCREWVAKQPCIRGPGRFDDAEQRHVFGRKAGPASHETRSRP